MGAKKQTEAIIKLQELWMLAARKDVEIQCASKSEATHLRFKLYNAVKAVRLRPELNERLAEVLESVQLTLKGEDKSIVWIGKSNVSKVLDETFERLGIDGTSIHTKDDTELEADDSFRRLQEKMKGMPVEQPEPENEMTSAYRRYPRRGDDA